MKEANGRVNRYHVNGIALFGQMLASIRSKTGNQLELASLLHYQLVGQKIYIFEV